MEAILAADKGEVEKGEGASQCREWVPLQAT